MNDRERRREGGKDGCRERERGGGGGGGGGGELAELMQES